VRLPFGTNNREELARPDVATLSVICYQRGRDNYARIIESSGQLGVTEDDVTDADEVTQTERVRVNLTPFKTQIRVPEVEAEIEASVSFSTFTPRVELTDDETVAKLVGVDILEGEREEVGVATATVLADPVAHLAQTLLERVPELGPRDAAAVAKVVKAYLKAATNSDEKTVWNEYLVAKRRYAREDLLRQIRDNIKKDSDVEYCVSEADLDFGPYETVLPVGAGVRDYRTVPNGEIRQSLVGVYDKTIYEGYRFDAQQEKWLGDALDKDDGVDEWLKVPEGKLVIRTPAGRYLPDLIARTDKAMYLLEVKRAREVEERNPGVVEKAKRAREWCEAITKATGVVWRYYLLRHDRIKEGDTLSGMLSGAVNLDEFIDG
jgi:hypothetical protein